MWVSKESNQQLLSRDYERAFHILSSAGVSACSLSDAGRDACTTECVTWLVSLINCERLQKQDFSLMTVRGALAYNLITTGRLKSLLHSAKSGFLDS